MKHFIQCLFLIILISSCSQNPENQAKEILHKSMKSHGGEGKWRDLKSLKFKKWTKLLTDSGTVESELAQEFEFRFEPYFEGKISWVKDSTTHVSIWNGSAMSYFMGGNEIQNLGFLESKKSDFDAAFYAVAQPWKLLDQGATLVYSGQKILENGLLADVVRVDYGPETDVWWYYFDPISFLLIGNEVQLKDHRSLIYTTTYEQAGGLVLHGERVSHRVDQNGNRLYLRAAYRYTDFEVQF